MPREARLNQTAGVANEWAELKEEKQADGGGGGNL